MLSFFGELARGNNTPPMEEIKEFIAMTHQLMNDKNCCFDNMKETNETIEFLKIAMTAVENDDELTSNNNTLVTMANEETNLNKTTNTNKKVTMENGNASCKQLVETCKVQHRKETTKGSGNNIMSFKKRLRRTTNLSHNGSKGMAAPECRRLCAQTQDHG